MRIFHSGSTLFATILCVALLTSCGKSDREELNELREDLEKTSASIDSAIDDLNQEIETLRVEQSKLQDRLEAMRVETQTLTSNLSSLESASASIDARSRDVSDQLEDLGDRVQAFSDWESGGGWDGRLWGILIAVIAIALTVLIMVRMIRGGEIEETPATPIDAIDDDSRYETVTPPEGGAREEQTEYGSISFHGSARVEREKEAEGESGDDNPAPSGQD